MRGAGLGPHLLFIPTRNEKEGMKKRGKKRKKAVDASDSLI